MTTLLLLYSKFSESCKTVIDLFQKAPFNVQKGFTLLCIDDPQIRKRVQELNIRYVPSVILYKDNQPQILYDDPHIVIEWLLSQLQPQSVLEETKGETETMWEPEVPKQTTKRSVSEMAKIYAKEREDLASTKPLQDLQKTIVSKDHYLNANKRTAEESLEGRVDSLKSNNLPFQERMEMESQSRSSSVSDLASKMLKERESLA